jgi:XTP/dITP diphosphohydrolase
VLATHNRNKIKEIKAIIEGLPVTLKTLDDFPEMPEAVEDAGSFEGNALIKARAISQYTELPAIADDSGLEVDALCGAPGINSARFAGVHGDSKANNIKLLELMSQVADNKRSARFRCSIALTSPDGRESVVSGAIEGRIIRTETGSDGFGYDPIFIPDGYDQTFAQIPFEEKNKISHRSRALAKLKEKLREFLE